MKLWFPLPHPYRIESGIESINLMIKQKPQKLAFAHHAIRPNAEGLLRKHIDQLKAWEICVRDCINKGITEEEEIAVELSEWIMSSPDYSKNLKILWIP